ncbi:hypothetical protein [Providencia sneebia]|uniref:Uncharacterized protein n=1 Tax=Providencia sneebia DSM 19967 TaxID=1141660 RepID=K8W4K0_9GAMM|nr:hypothetical protein OO7_11034 [Providencia sneebia DSM 19967]
MFQLADRWGEPDPRKIAQLPANILTYWQAFFISGNEEEPEFQSTTTQMQPDIEAQCNDVMRIING